MKTKLLLTALLALLVPACGTTGTEADHPAAIAARERINAALSRLASQTITLGELAAATQLDKLRVKVIPQK
jgi:hypothetical protein